MNEIETIEYKECRISIYTDDDPMNPREEDNLGTMVCSHKNYLLGDVQVKGRDGFFEHIRSNFSVLELMGYGYLEEDDIDKIKRWIDKNLIILPLYLYDHSGISISTSGFSCPWDSGQVGYIYVPLSKVREEYNVKGVSSKLRKRAEDYLMSEVETYDKFLTGQVYGYTIIDQTGEEDVDVDTCNGYYNTSECIAEAKAYIDWYDNEKYPLFKEIA